MYLFQINVVTGDVRGGSVFRGQTRLQIGGKWHELLGRVERPYRGVMAGLVYNKLRCGMVWYGMTWYGMALQGGHGRARLQQTQVWYGMV